MQFLNSNSPLTFYAATGSHPCWLQPMPPTSSRRWVPRRLCLKRKPLPAESSVIRTAPKSGSAL